MKVYIARAFRFLLHYLPRFLYRVIPPSSSIVLIGTNNGQFKESSKYLFLYMYQSTGLRPVWIGSKSVCSQLKSQGYKASPFWSIKTIYYVLRASFAFYTHSSIGVSPIGLRPDCIQVNLWHGTPIKLIGHDRPGAKDLTKRGFKYEVAWGVPDYLVVSSPHLISRMSQAMGIHPSRVLPVGSPKNDILHNAKLNSSYSFSVKANILKTYKIPCNKQLVIYAPTHRDSGDAAEVHLQSINQLIIASSASIFAESHQLLLRLHPYQSHLLEGLKLPSCVTNVSDLPDIQPLLIASSQLITDYSSILYDYSILERPIHLYYPQSSFVSGARGGCYDQLSDLPFNAYYSVDSLLKAIIAPPVDQSDNYVFSRQYNYGFDASHRLLSSLSLI